MCVPVQDRANGVCKGCCGSCMQGLWQLHARAVAAACKGTHMRPVAHCACPHGVYSRLHLSCRTGVCGLGVRCSESLGACACLCMLTPLATPARADPCVESGQAAYRSRKPPPACPCMLGCSVADHGCPREWPGTPQGLKHMLLSRGCTTEQVSQHFRSVTF